jgi:drug/metabolite transporter (DMT)-like permease
MAILFALGSSAVWGVSDYLGGVFSRRHALAGVTLVSQATGFVGLLVWLAATGFHVDGRAFGFGLLAGIGGGSGLALFYRALAVGTMSVVSPVAACGALVPFALALAGGERPSTFVLTGAVVALGGAVLASADEHRAEDAGRRKGALLAIAAAVVLGLFLYFLGRGGQHGEALSALVGARVGSLTLLAIWAAATRAPARLDRTALPAVAGIGLLDVSANALFVLASARGYLSIVSVLGSLYPIATVLAAYALLGERINRVQRVGVALALTGVAVVAAG